VNLATATDLIERYGALQNPREVLCLLEYLGRNPPTLMIEVGVWRGGNAAILKTAFPDLRIIGVDELTVDSEKVSDAPSLRTAVETFGIEMVQGDTRSEETVDLVRAMIGDRRADYLFIDASHDTDSVIADFARWSPLATLVGFHDVHNPMVYAAWNEIVGFFRDGPRACAMYKEPDGHGIGLVLT
jgi:cephalosporin hydroxylase